MAQLWPEVLRGGIEIEFAHLSFKWSNSAMHNAGVTCVVIGLALARATGRKRIYQGELTREASSINPYLVDGPVIYVESVPSPKAPNLPMMLTGSVLNDDGNLVLSDETARALTLASPVAADWVCPFFGSDDYINGLTRHCLLIPDSDLPVAHEVKAVSERLTLVARAREKSDKREAREILALTPHRFQHHAPRPRSHSLIVPSVSSEHRNWFPAGLLDRRPVISNLAFMIPDGPLWCLAILVSRLQHVWIATVCGKLKTDFRYSNTLGWNTFPIPTLTQQNKADLTSTAEEILLAREAHYPATIAELYDPKRMPADLKAAHERNDEVLERIYIGRKFRNDSERLEKLFEMYTRTTSNDQRQQRRRS